MFKKLIAAFMALFAFASIAKADITDGAFGANQIFDVQYYWSGSTLNASSFIAPYDKNFSHPTVGPGEYFKFVPSTTNPGDFGMNLYRADGTLKQVVHDYGQITALGNGAIFYLGSGWLGNVITPASGYAYGQSATFTNMDTSVTSADLTSYTWASTTPLAAGQTASTTPTTPPVVTPNYVSVNPTVVNVYPTSNNSPVGEAAAQALDATSSTKYLNFDRANAGFTIKLPAGKVVSALQFTTANDFIPRDPTKFTLQGSNDGVNWTPITVDQAITLSDSRFTTSANIAINNTTPYVYYFITFTSIKAIDQYGSIAGCQAALGQLSCDSVQIGDVTFLTDSNNTATSTDTATAGSRVVNPGAPVPIITNGTPTVTSSSVTGTTTNSAVAVRGTTVTTVAKADSAVKANEKVTVTRVTTTTRVTPITTTTTWRTPVTTTTVTTPKIVTTYSDGTTSEVDGTPVTTTTTTYQDVTATTITYETIATPVSETASASTGTVNDAIKISRTNPFLVDPLAARDANWIAPRVGFASTANGKYTAGGMSFGRQWTVDENTFGIAFDVADNKSSAYLNAQGENTSYAGTAYILNKQDYVWTKMAIGGSTAEHSATIRIPQFGMINTTKAKQTNFYGDVALYSGKDFYGIRPFIGATLVNSNISNVSYAGTNLLNTPVTGSKSFGIPYAGLRYDLFEGTAVEYKYSQTPDFRGVHGVRATSKHKISDDVSIDFIIGHDKGGRGYNNTYGMVGFTWKF